MRKQISCSGCSVVGMAFLSGLAACASSSVQADITGAKDSGRSDSTAPLADASCKSGDPNNTTS
jgi:hypothetical protein